MKIEMNDILITKKKHVCGSDRWLVTRVGADIKIRCETCGREIMFFKPTLEKRIKSIQKANKAEISDK